LQVRQLDAAKPGGERHKPLQTNIEFQLNPQHPKLFGVKFSLRAIKRIFPLNYAILSFGKCLNYYISGLQRGDIFFNFDKTQLKRSSKIKFSVSEPQRWAVVGLSYSRRT